MADQFEAQQKRRRRLTIAGSVAAAVVVIGGAGAAIALSGGGGHPSAQHSPAASVTASAPASSPASQPPAPQPTAVPSTVGTLAASRGPVALALGKDAKEGQVAGYAGKALLLPSGADSFAATIAPVVDVTRSFTVSARARGDNPAGNRTVISQGTSDFYTFLLGRTVSGGANHWLFKVQVKGGGSVSVESKGAAAVNQWSVVTGVYDVSAHRIQLYVNGALQGSAAVNGGINTWSGGLQIGRVRSQGQWVDPWHGQVAAVEVWQRALTAAQAVQVAAGTSSGVPQPDNAWLTG